MKNTTHSNSGIWLMRFTDLYQLKIVEGLLDQKHDVNLFTGNDFILKYAKDLFAKINDNNLVFYNNNELALGKTNVTDKTNWNNLDHIYKYCYIAHQIMERNERYAGDILFEERNHLVLKQYQFWSNEIKHRHPQCVIFMDTPHMYYEMILMGLLESNNIPYLIVAYTPNQSRVIYFEKNFKIASLPGGHSFNEVHKDYLSIAKKKIMTSIDININNSFIKWPYLIKRIIGFTKRLLNMKAYTTDTYTNGYYLKSGYFKTGYSSAISEYYQELKYTYKAIILRSYYLKNTTTPSAQKYVYFPLSAGYENTLHPGASPWNYVSLLEYISMNIPDDIYIYVKEHPAQFNFRHHQRFARSIEFYKRIKAINNVKLMGINSDQFNLMNGAVCVIACSMSSTAYQVIALEKKLLCYGPDVLPQQYSVNLFDVDLKSIETIQLSNNKCAIDSKYKAYHFERGYFGSNEEAISISKKISGWIKSQSL
jgi:hypothetical protein